MSDDMLSPAQRITRRELMRRSLLGGAAIGLGPSLLSALEGTAAAATAAGGTINFFSWQGYDLLDEPVMKAWRKKNGVTDDPVAATVIGAHVTGVFRPDSRYTHAQLDKIIAFWKTLKANARLIVPSYGNMGDLFASGEIIAATPGWAAVNSFAAAKGDKAVKHVAPAEGTGTFCDAFMIPNNAKDTDAVYAYINQAFSLEAQAQEAQSLVQAAV